MLGDISAADELYIVLSTSCRKSRKYGVFYFLSDGFCDKIKTSEKEWKTDGKVSERCQAH